MKYCPGKKEIIIAAIILFVFSAVIFPKECMARSMDSYSESAEEAEEPQKTITVTADENRGDDTAVIQSALNSVQTESGITVKIEAGSYTISDTLTIYSNTTLKLEKGALITRSGTNFTMLKSCADEETGGYGQAENITVSGGVWDGGAENGNASTSGIMSFHHAQNIVIKNCTVKGVVCKHMVTLAGVKNCKVSNVTFKDQYAYDGYDTESYYNGHTDEEYIDLFNGSCEALHLDVITEDGVSEPGAYPLDNTVNENVVVKDCTFDNVVVGAGNHMPHRFAGGYSTGLTVTGNDFKNVSYYAVNIYGQMGSVIKNNKAKNVRGFAYIADSENIDIEWNSILLKGEKESLSYSYAAVYTEFGTGITIKNNSIVKRKAYGITDYGDVNSETNTSTVTKSGNVITNSVKESKKIKNKRARIEKNRPWKYISGSKTLKMRGKKQQ